MEKESAQKAQKAPEAKAPEAKALEAKAPEAKALEGMQAQEQNVQEEKAMRAAIHATPAPKPARIALPGEVIFDYPKRTPGAYIESGKTYAAQICLVRGTETRALKGTYMPSVDDFVIGILKEETFAGWVVDLKGPYDGLIEKTRKPREFRVGRAAAGRAARRAPRLRELRPGLVVSAWIDAVDELHNAHLRDARVLEGGELLEVESVKVPRIIGRGGSMVELLKRWTGCEILVGYNGRIYIKGSNAALAALAILKICDEAHLPGLTERIALFLKSEAGGVPPATASASAAPAAAPAAAQAATSATSATQAVATMPKHAFKSASVQVSGPRLRGRRFRRV